MWGCNGGGGLDGHTVKTGFKNEPQGNGEKQSPRDQQTFGDMQRRGPGVSDPDKKQSRYLKTANLPVSKVGASA